MAPPTDGTEKLYYHIKVLYSLLCALTISVSVGMFLIHRESNTEIVRAAIQSYWDGVEADFHKDFKMLQDLNESGNGIPLRRRLREAPDGRTPEERRILSKLLQSAEFVEYCTALYDHCNVKNKGEPGPPGEKGNRGTPGMLGSPGSKGERGTDGRPGTNGIPGRNGMSGLKGDMGHRGPMGPMGPKGDIGIPGHRGPPGKTGPAGTPGPRGDKGEDGAEGPMGLLGFPGYKGNRGDAGVKGEKGELGPKGHLGPMGPPGHKGLPGSKGDEGRRGRKGARGMTGKIGLQGRHGSPGLPGKNGQKGERGDRGFQGNGSNCSCPKGDKGDKGVRGLIGFTGYKGDKGDHGNKGNKGYGERGFPGFQGIPGPKGERGEKGEKGDVFSSVAMDNWRMATAVPSVTYRGERTPSSTKEMMTSTTSTTTTPTTMTTPTTTTPPTTTTMAPPTLAPRRRGSPWSQTGANSSAFHMTSSPEVTFLSLVMLIVSLLMTIAHCVHFPSSEYNMHGEDFPSEVIKMIGIPLLLRQAGPASGAWMTDPDSSPKRWVSNNEYANILYEYRSETTFKENRVDNTYDLSFFHYHGYDHVIRHGSFYFQWAGRNIVVKYDLKEAIVSSAAEIDGASHNTSRYLYKNGTTYFDIEYDENGLWVIYSKLSDDKNIFVVKLNTNTMEAIRIWTINIAPGSYGNGIIVCGVLYLIRDTVNVQTVIDYAYDLYTDEVVPLGKDIKFRNPFGASSMVSYVPNIRHPQNSRINSWDNGRQLSFQLLFV